MFARKSILALGVLLAATQAASALTFSSFTAIPSSVAGGSLPESKPFQLGNPLWQQASLADRDTQVALGQFNSGSWDMNTQNEGGTDAGKFLFTVFETAQAGVQRTNLQTGTTETLWKSPTVAPALNSAVAFDASYWTPWNTYITAEESWGSQPQPYGRLFELTNPLTASTETGVLVPRNAVPRVSHEGIQFDRAGNMYFIDELNGGCIYRFSSTTPGQATFFEAGQTSVLRVGDGSTPNATGAFSWVPFTDASGAALPGATTIVDPNGISAVDGRATTDITAFKGTDYQRPEDLQIKVLPNGNEVMYVATTTTNEVYAINLTTGVNTVLVNRDTINLASGLAVGNALTSPDNLAIDAEGNIYIIEDQPGGSADIWFVNDANNDGVAESIARWATMSTLGAEPTGLYFDRFDPTKAYVNVQHPTSGNDRLIVISIPEPTGLVALLPVAGMLMRRRSR